LKTLKDVKESWEFAKFEKNSTQTLGQITKETERIIKNV